MACERHSLPERRRFRTLAALAPHSRLLRSLIFPVCWAFSQYRLDCWGTLSAIPCGRFLCNPFHSAGAKAQALQDAGGQRPRPLVVAPGAAGRRGRRPEAVFRFWQPKWRFLLILGAHDAIGRKRTRGPISPIPAPSTLKSSLKSGSQGESFGQPPYCSAGCRKASARSCRRTSTARRSGVC